MLILNNNSPQQLTKPFSLKFFCHYLSAKKKNNYKVQLISLPIPLHDLYYTNSHFEQFVDITSKVCVLVKFYNSYCTTKRFTLNFINRHTLIASLDQIVHQSCSSNDSSTHASDAKHVVLQSESRKAFIELHTFQRCP